MSLPEKRLAARKAPQVGSKIGLFRALRAAVPAIGFHAMTKPKRQAPPFHIKPIALGVDDAGVVLDCGRTKVYDLIDRGCLDAYKQGASTKITMASIERHVADSLKEGFRKGRHPTRRAVT
jgi:Helix-turn-helix domain